MKRALILTAIATALGASTPAWTQPGMGPGTGYGPGYGMAPGMMGGYGTGPGMAPGMMGGYGPGPGASGRLGALDLTDEQRERILAIQEEIRRKNWDTMGQMRAEQFKRVDELRREMLVSRLESRKQIESVLTPEQRKQFRQFGPRWLEDAVIE